MTLQNGGFDFLFAFFRQYLLRMSVLILYLPGFCLLLPLSQEDGVAWQTKNQGSEFERKVCNAIRLPGLNGVEIGYAILARQVLKYLPPGNVSFERTVYPALAGRRLLRAVTTEHRYYGVGSHERLPLTETFLARQRTVIVDRDGVLNVRPGRAQYIRSWAEWTWLAGAREALRVFKDAGYRVIVISNQAGIARGLMTDTNLAAIHERMQVEVREAGGAIDAIYYCPHGWGDDACECRKPKPGMLYQAQRDFALDLSRTVFIGDDERDGQAAVAAGCPFVSVSAERTLLDVARGLVGQGEAVHGVADKVQWQAAS
jgi:D-glycero-D-manno-heptose 1,7-bisphosphate phosphatase